MATQETITGIAKVFGINASSSSIATMVVLTGAATITITSIDGSHEFDMEELTGQDGNVETIMAWKERIAVSINWEPNGAARTNARTSLLNTKPAMLSKVVIANCSAPPLDGDYNYVGGWSPKLTPTGRVQISMKLLAHIANRASLTSAVIAT